MNTLQFLRKSIKWNKRDPNHDVSWYVEEGCECDYEYDEKDPQPYNVMQPWLLDLRDAMCEQLDIDTGNPPNSCNINWYYNGFAGIGKHADDEELFEGKTKSIKIISVSIGAEREFEIYEEIKQDEDEESKSSEKELIDDTLESTNIQKEQTKETKNAPSESADDEKVSQKEAKLNPNAASFSISSNGSKYVSDSSNLSALAEEFTPSVSEETSDKEKEAEYKLLHSIVLTNMLHNKSVLANILHDKCDCTYVT